MNIIRITAVLGFLFAGLSTTVIGQSADQNWDYKAYPEYQYDVSSVLLNAEFDPEEVLIKGIVRYTFTANRPGLTEILMNTSDISIEGVSMGGSDLDYLVESDSLLIVLPDTMQNGESGQIYVTFQSSSEYGFHKDHKGNIWTSLNPGALHHWLPVFDNPVNSASVEAYFTVPVTSEIVFNGLRKEDEIVSAEQKKIHWVSGGEIPLTQLFLAIGDLSREQALSGITKTDLYFNRGTKSDAEVSEHLNTAVSSLKEFEGRLSFQYPYEYLQIVILPDNFWEEVQWGAGVIVVYENLGDIRTQIRRGLIAQWFGSFQRNFAVGSELRKMEFLRSVMMPDAAPFSVASGLMSIDYWNRFSTIVPGPDNEYMINLIRNSAAGLLKENSGVVQWSDLAQYWYEETGLYWDDIPVFNNAEISVNRTEDTIVQETGYSVQYLYNEMNSDLTLIFESRQDGSESLQDLSLTQFGFGDTVTTELLVTGSLDSVDVNTITGIEYAVLNYRNEGIRVDETKPFSFLINQLRSVDKQLRIEAATGLRGYIQSPDLQLALNDALAFESDPEVKAALLGTLNMITRGDTGTEQTFISELRSEPIDIRLSAARALADYPGNAAVQSALRATLLQTDNDSLFSVALEAYASVSETASLSSLARRYQSADSTGLRTLLIVDMGIDSDSTGNLGRIAMNYLTYDYPYKARIQALNTLKRQSAGLPTLGTELEKLLSDYDPRIRNEAVKALSAMGMNEVLRSYSNEEYDPRIIQTLDSVLNN